MTSTEAVDELLIRPADDADADAVAAVHLAARRAAAPLLPLPLHPDDEVRSWLAGRVGADETWVAEVSGRVVGYARCTPGWLEDLYVDPAHARAGVGSALLDVVKARHPDGFALWVFESNKPARRFYAARGLVELERTDGSGNEERAPDVRMAWPGREPLAFFRSCIDEVDDDLADVLKRRAALTAAVQAFKPVPGHAGRDLERERVIAERLHARAPVLPVEGWQRILAAVIEVSLDAAGGHADRLPG